ncbi:MAG: hypothetical protein GX174_13350 [Lentisphaerae bacterium]|jgi:hypothetical protein|nr:hypothetical protein [Lentisphaerota bacterium]
MHPFIRSLNKYAALALTALAALAATHAFASKNVLDVWYGQVPGAPESLLASQPQIWSFAFRPYGAAAADLWSDPIMARNALAGEDAGGKSPTAVAVTCDADGFTVLVLCVEAALHDAIARTNALPDSYCEIYVAPDDIDNRDMIPYYQFGLNAFADGKFDHFPWIVEDRRMRTPTPYMDFKTRLLPNGYLHVLNFSWEAFWDKLPMKDRADNFWRMSLIRWVDGGVSWGGVVHEASRFGYIRFPRFTPEQRAEIRFRLLQRAWTRFRKLHAQPAYNTTRGWAAPWPREDKFIVDALDGLPETFIHYTQDPVFSRTLKQLVDERLALAPGIAAFKEMPADEQEAFYNRAADMLFNFRYDVEKAYTSYVDDKLFAEGDKK